MQYFHHLLEFLAEAFWWDQPPLSANDKGDNEVELEAKYRSHGDLRMPEENPRKPQLGDHLMKAVRPVSPQM